MKVFTTALVCTIAGMFYGIGMQSRPQDVPPIVRAEVVRTSKLEFAAGTATGASPFSIELERQDGLDSLVVRSADTSTTLRLINGVARLERAGKPRIEIGVSEAGGASVVLLRPNSFPAIRMSLNPDGLALLGVYDATGHGQDIDAESISRVILNSGK